MVQTLIAALLLAAQTPAPPADEVAEGVAGQEETATQAEAREPEEELICRTIRVPSERVGVRFRKREVCQTRDEWDAERRSRR